MSSWAHSFHRLENRLSGPGAAASLVCQILLWSLQPSSSASPCSLHAETCVHTGTHTRAHTHRYTQAYTWGSRSLTVQRTHTCILTQMCMYNHMYLHTGTFVHADMSLHTCIQTMSTSCAHDCWQECTLCLVHVCTYTGLALYTCVHMASDMLTYPHPFAHHCTSSIYTDTKLHLYILYIQMVSIVMDTHLHTGHLMTEGLYITFCTQCTQLHRLPTAGNTQQS